MKKKTSKARTTKKTRKPDDLSPRSSQKDRDLKGGVVQPTKIEYPNIVLKQGTSG